MNKLIGSLFIGWALLRNLGGIPARQLELPQCVPPPPTEEALLPDGTQFSAPEINLEQDPLEEFIREQEAAAAKVRQKFPSYPESVLQREIANPEPIKIVTPIARRQAPSEIVYIDPNIPWSYSVQAAPHQTPQTFPFYNCTTSS